MLNVTFYVVIVRHLALVIIFYRHVDTVIMFQQTLVHVVTGYYTHYVQYQGSPGVSTGNTCSLVEPDPYALGSALSGPSSA